LKDAVESVDIRTSGSKLQIDGPTTECSLPKLGPQFSSLVQHSCSVITKTDNNCNCNWGTCIVPPTRRLRVHYRVNPYPGAHRQNETEMFTDHDETILPIAAVSAPSVACSMLAVQQQKRLCRQFVDVSACRWPSETVDVANQNDEYYHHATVAIKHAEAEKCHIGHGYLPTIAALMTRT